MPTILVTGFQPFAGLARNPSAEVVQALPDVLPCGARLVRRVLPVERLAGPAEALEATDGVDAAVGLGLALGSSAIQVERVFVNLCEDQGFQGRLVEDGPDGWFSSLPTALLRDAALGTGVPAQLSNTAGTYICNALGYQLRQQRPDLPAGFVHLPATPADDLPQGTPTLLLQDEVTAVTALLTALDDWLLGQPPPPSA